MRVAARPNNPEGRRDVRFIRLEEHDYEAFLAERERVYFTQLLAFAHARRHEGFRADVVGLVDDDGAVRAAAIVQFQPWKRFFRRARIFYGPVLARDAQDSSEIQERFYAGLLDWLRAIRTVLSLEVAPAVLRRRYDDLTELEETAEGERFDTLAEELGFSRVHLDFEQQSDIANRFVYVKEIGGMDFPAIASSVNQQVRTGFNRWGANGVDVQFVDPSRIDLLGGVLDSTAERTGAHRTDAAQLAFYKDLATRLGEDAFLPVAILRTRRHLEEIAAEREAILPRIAEIDEQEAERLAAGEKLSKKQRTQRNELRDRLAVLGKREQETRRIREESGDEVVLAASFFIHSHGELTYLVSGAYAQYNSYMGIYLIHRAMFEWAAAHGVRRYNFWGISGDFGPEALDAGVLHFKRQFRGNVEEFVGTYEFAVRPRLARWLGALRA